MRIILLITFSTLVLSFFGQTKDTISDVDKKPYELIDEDKFMHVSLIKLIANPEKYHKKRIQVHGFLNLQFEGNAIYFHKEDYERLLYENGFWVEFSKKLEEKKNLKDYNKSYVIIIGTFNMNRQGHMGLFAGTFENIVRLDYWNF